MAALNLSKYRRVSSPKVWQGFHRLEKNKDMTVCHLSKNRKGFLTKGMAGIPWIGKHKDMTVFHLIKYRVWPGFHGLKKPKYGSHLSD
jgi:hypothetical protein